MHDHILYKKRTLESIVLIILGYFGYAVSDTVAKILQDHYNVFQVMGVNAVLALCILTPWIHFKYGIKTIFPPNLKLHLLRACFVFATAYLMVRSLHLLPLADFYGIAFTIPFFTMFLAYAILKERVGWHRIMAAVFGFGGVLIIAGPQFEHIGHGVALALGGAVVASFNIIVLRKIGHGAPIPVYGFWPFLFLAVGSAIALLINGEARAIQMEDVKFIFLAPPFTVLGIAALSLGFTRAPDTTIVSPFHYTQIIWGVSFGWLFFQTLPPLTTYVGIAMIICAGCYSLWREYKRKHHIPD